MRNSPPSSKLYNTSATIREEHSQQGTLGSSHWSKEGVGTGPEIVIFNKADFL